MSEKREYTAEDYDRVGRYSENWCGCDTCRIRASALRIASAVMKPGVIEGVIGMNNNLSYAIRKTLLGEG